MNREKLHDIIFGTETPSGKAFDLALIIFICLSVLTVVLETVTHIQMQYIKYFFYLEWFFTLVFSAEYILRVYCTKNPRAYIFSFFGLVDLFSILPSYLSFFFPGTQSLLVIRGLRLLRVFRVLKLSRYTDASRVLVTALSHSRHKIAVFLGGVITLVLIVGAVMYLVEGKEHGFTSIPKSVYWAIVTITTVGYGDISPATPLGQIIASVLMILGFAIIAVPTGIVTAEISSVSKEMEFKKICSGCNKEMHEIGAQYCSKCGTKL